MSRDQKWGKFYNDNMREDAHKPDPAGADMEKLKGVALAEARFGEALWNRDFQSSALILQNALDDAFDLSQSTGAWLTLWLGFALEMTGDREGAREHYVKAHGNQRNLPRPQPEHASASAPVSDQILNVQQQMWVGHPRPSAVQAPRTLIKDLTALNGSGSVPQTEEALRCLGQYLGLESTRPDKEFGKGPDVLWLGKNGCAVCMEVKSDKQPTSPYSKDDVGQLHNHIQWVKDSHEVSEVIPIFVGPLLTASNQASPSPDMRGVELGEFEELGKKLVSALRDVARGAIPLSLGNDLHEGMKNRGLVFPDVLLSLEMSPLQVMSLEEPNPTS